MRVQRSHILKEIARPVATLGPVSIAHGGKGRDFVILDLKKLFAFILKIVDFLQWQRQARKQLASKAAPESVGKQMARTPRGRASSQDRTRGDTRLNNSIRGVRTTQHVAMST